jgi:tetratricopeptide (TPR) repeat protein
MASAASGGKPEIHLRRAWGFITEVENATEKLRERALQHNALVEQDQPFVASLVRISRSSGDLKREKGALVSDLQLATQELDQAASLNPNAVVHVDSANLGIKSLQAMILYLSGQIEMIWGTSRVAKETFYRSVQIADLPEARYMLGLIYESEYNPAQALKEFEKCLELDPDGEFSVPALREANAMRNYKKRFRGSWGLFFLLLLIWPVAIVYFAVQYK